MAQSTAKRLVPSKSNKEAPPARRVELPTEAWLEILLQPALDYHDMLHISAVSKLLCTLVKVRPPLSRMSLHMERGLTALSLYDLRLLPRSTTSFSEVLL